jgi:hypothetical protein
MNRRRSILLVLVVVAVGCVLLGQPNRGPMYHGRRTADWVEQTFKDRSRSEAFETVLKIGAPAVPFVARGLHDRSHTFHFLSVDHLMYFCNQHPSLGRWVPVENCAGKHAQAAWLLWCMGTNAQAAIPDVTDCLENCPNLHFMGALDLLDTLAEISGTNPAAIPCLTRLARGGDSLNMRAAATAYYINGQTNLFVETCERLSRKEPEWLLDGPELFWFRNEPKLNQHLIPLLEKLYLNSGLASRQREEAFDALASRINDPAAVLFCRRFQQK